MAGAAAQSRWMHSLSVPAEFEYDSNPSMTPGESPGSTRWLRLMPSLTTKYVHGNEEFAVEAALSAEKSSNTEVAQDRLDPRLRAAWRHVDALNTTEVAALLERQAFRDVDMRQQVPLGVDGTRTRFALSGSWLRDLDARTSFMAEGRQEWERSDVGIAPDFRRTTAMTRLRRAHDPRTDWYVGLDGQTVDPEPLDDTVAAPVVAGRSTVFGAVVGVERAFSEGFRVDANVGPVRFTRPQARSDWQGAVTAEYKGERWVGTVEVLRAPSLDILAGGLEITEELRTRVRYDLDPVSRLEAEAGGAREKAADSRRTLASVSWIRELSADWQLVVKGTTQRQQGPGGTARSNRIGVMLVYNMPDL